MIARWPQTCAAGGAFCSARCSSLLLFAPLFASDYLLSVSCLILYLRLCRPGLELMLGFAGQLSLGHALYVGARRLCRGALFVHFDVAPWFGAAGSRSRLRRRCGAAIGWLAFRFGISRRVFRAADHRVRRVHAHRLRSHRLARRPRRSVPAGAAARARRSVESPRAARDVSTTSCCCCAVLALLLCRQLLHSRAGYYFRAIREDEAGGARRRHARVRCKLYAVAGVARPSPRSQACSSRSITTACFPSRCFTSAARSRSCSAR